MIQRFQQVVRLGERTPENQIEVVSGLAVGEQISLTDR
jgi:hypothetical protein